MPALVSGNFFSMLAVQAALGRPLTPLDDERFAGRPVIVLSHAAWTRLFASNPNAIGRTVLINATPFEIVGVTLVSGRTSRAPNARRTRASSW